MQHVQEVRRFFSGPWGHRRSFPRVLGPQRYAFRMSFLIKELENLQGAWRIDWLGRIVPRGGSRSSHRCPSGWTASGVGRSTVKLVARPAASDWTGPCRCRPHHAYTRQILVMTSEANATVDRVNSSITTASLRCVASKSQRWWSREIATEFQFERFDLLRHFKSQQPTTTTCSCKLF